MTLLSQINSLLFTLFLLLMTSLIYFQFTETKAFMENQMESDLNNTVTSLSLRLKPHLESGDEASVNTLINVIIEGGFYNKVKLTWLSDKKNKVWDNKIIHSEVPQWFIDLKLFDQQSKEVTITSGWLQLATLEVESNLAIGYIELWHIMKSTLMILSVSFLVSVAAVHIRLKRILAPLYDVAKHAHDVSHRKFHPEMRLPSTTELKEVVSAVNLMSKQLKQVFKALDEEVENHKKDNLCDRVSQLPNRQYLTGQLNSWLSEPDSGALLLADFSWLNEVHSQYGYQMRDQAVKELAEKFTTDLDPESEVIVARISNVEFAFLLRNVEKREVTQYLQKLIRLVNQEIMNAGATPNKNFAIGASLRTKDITRAELLSQADNALQKAINEHKTYHWFYVKNENIYSREAWRTKLVEAITHNHFIFQWQPITEFQGSEVIHREIYCRLEIDDKIVQASQFMPYIERFSLGSQLDKCLIESIDESGLLSQTKEPIAVNISRRSVSDPSFHRWLATYLESIVSPEKLNFEISEAAITQNLAASIALCDIVEKAGSKFGVDNCGRQMGSLTYLQELKPHYLKLDLSLSCYENGKNKVNQPNIELCKTLTKIARGLDISVISTGVENDKHLEAITPIKPSGYQGYIFPPTDIESN